MLQRSPIIVGLLFAATLAVDCVSVYWLWDSPFGRHSGPIFMALSYGQISLLAAWAVLQRRQIGWRWLAPLIASLLSAAILLMTFSLNDRVTLPTDVTVAEFYRYLTGIYVVYAAPALLSLWLLKPSPLVRRAGGSDRRPPWQFSVGNLLILITGTSLLLPVLVENELLGDVALKQSAVIAGNLALLVTIVIVSSQAWQWLIRIGASLAAAITIGGVCELSGVEIDFVPYYLIYGTILIAWLELGPVLPPVDAVFEAGAKVFPK
jgi:hypothetical protein